MKKILVAIFACAFGCLSVNAQSEDYVDYPYAYVGVRGGAQTIFLKKNDGDRQISPSIGLSLGNMFNPYLGGRIDLTGIWNKIDFSGTKESFRTVNANFDLLLNVTNLFRAEKKSPFNFYLLGGPGVIILNTQNESYKNANNNLFYDWYNFRAGVIADVALSRLTSLNLEVDGNYMGGSESETYGNGKWKVAAYLGLNVKLPYAKKEEPVSAPVTSQAEYDAAAAQAAEAAAAAAAAKKARELELARKAAEAKKAETAAAAKVKEEPIDDTIFFTIGKTDKADKWNDVVDAAANWCKKYSNKTITVAGYADKGTGSAKVNAKVAEARATKVANAIKSKGVPADQIKVTSYGDTVQPFNENDQNRCVIVSGK